MAAETSQELATDAPFFLVSRHNSPARCNWMLSLTSEASTLK